MAVYFDDVYARTAMAEVYYMSLGVYDMLRYAAFYFTSYAPSLSSLHISSSDI